MNKAMLRRVAKRLRRLRHESHYDQTLYAEKTECGTAACLAGFAVLEAGYRFAFPRLEYADVTCVLPGRGKDQPLHHIHDVARRVLGLSPADARHLFEGIVSDGWPYEFAERYQAAPLTGERRSRVAADLLDALADGKVKL